MKNTLLELDYPFLKEQGIAYIQQLAGKKWTDYGDHDPGITILEVLSFVIMDLEYRTNFYIEDIWTKDPDAVANPNEQPFYKAEEILPCNPLTQWDFLKIVLDVPGVKNANIFLSDGPKEIKGGYKIFVDVEERISHTLQEKEVLDLIKQRLYAQRNLCEDFFLIQTMETLPISIKATFEVANCLAYEEGETIIAQILFAFQEFFSPRITFYSISQLLEKGRIIDQIFTGPLLTQGFIDEEELICLKNKSRIYVVELLEQATKMASIKSVLNFELFIHEENTRTSSVTIPVLPDRSLVLDIPQSEIILHYNGLPISTDWGKVIDLLEDMKGRGTLTKAYLQEENVFVLEGNYRYLEDHVSIQQDFPLLYNVGHEGCSPSETLENQSKAKQLKSYLMFFDQLFANYLGQLSNIKHTMAIYSERYNQPNGRLPLDVSRMHSIIKQPTKESDSGNDLDFVVQRKYLDLKKEIVDRSSEDKDQGDATTKAYYSYINRALESDIRSLDKRSRVLDHLLAYFAERFTIYSLHLYPKNEEMQWDEFNTNKALFLKDYTDISKNRNRAAHIAANEVNNWIHYTPSGFKRRIYRNLGIKSLEKKLLHQVVKNSMYLDKKSVQYNLDIFLGKNCQTAYDDIFMFRGKYENLQSLVISYGINEQYYNIVKKANDTYSILLYVDKVKKHTIELVTEPVMHIEEAEAIVQQSVELLRALNQACEGFHLIEHILLRSDDTLTTEQDPYSFIMTMVFPAWPARFQQSSFRHAVEEMVLMEGPAHILTNTFWLDFEDMETFEKAYKSWILLKTDGKSSKVEIDAAAKVLMDLIASYNNKEANLCG
ncbi:Afp12-like phage baseplate wedge protein [Cardinium endosymbiont of Oedothorax gibbosus]|nr:Afp12-like phage baseplate wedge protein [Cardinium endosymbiont of Oedothorax gibbosus]